MNARENDNDNDRVIRRTKIVVIINSAHFAGYKCIKGCKHLLLFGSKKNYAVEISARKIESNASLKNTLSESNRPTTIKQPRFFLPFR